MSALAWGERVYALLAFGDEPKPGAAEAITRLHASGIRTVMISGDNRGAAEAMARRVIGVYEYRAHRKGIKIG